MAETTLSRELGREEAEAIRVLFARPLLHGATEREEFRLVVGCRARLQEWFEQACGWRLVVDVPGGFARLFKRTDHPDDSRSPLRTRGALAPFDRRRYEFLCLLCAELSSHPLTTIGLLAQGVASATTGYETRRFDSTRQRERMAFVDGLRLLAAWGVVAFSAGEVDAFVDSEHANALVTANTSRLHHLLASDAPPSALPPGDTAEAIGALAREPRYGDAPSGSPEVDPEQQRRWTRHSLARALLDDPAVYFERLSEEQAGYCANPAGRRWLRERTAEAGFVLEERAEGILAIDEDSIASDQLFPGPGSNVKQAALLLTDRFAPTDESGRRRLVDRSVVELTAAVRDLLAAHAGWARQYRDEGGAARLAGEAVDLLVRFRLAERTGGRVRPLPAIARYAASPSDPSPGHGPEDGGGVSGQVRTDGPGLWPAEDGT